MSRVEPFPPVLIGDENEESDWFNPNLDEDAAIYALGRMSYRKARAKIHEWFMKGLISQEARLFMLTINKMRRTSK